MVSSRLPSINAQHSSAVRTDWLQRKAASHNRRTNSEMAPFSVEVAMGLAVSSKRSTSE